MALPSAVEAQALTLNVGAGAYGGGDEVARIKFSDPAGEQSRTQIINAGAGVEVDVGVGYFPWISGFHSLGVEALFGARFWSAMGSAGRLRWVRVPIDIMPVYRFRFLQVAAGPTIVPLARIKSRGVFAGIDEKFDPAIGGNVEVGGLWSSNYFLGARYTYLNLSPRNGGGDVDAWSVGVSFRAYFSVWGDLAPTKPESDEDEDEDDYY